jgi:hypothetical protein
VKQMPIDVRRKPIISQAIRFVTIADWHDIENWMSAYNYKPSLRALDSSYSPAEPPDATNMMILFFDEDGKVYECGVGDWIVKDPDGWFSSFTDAALATIYDFDWED